MCLTINYFIHFDNLKNKYKPFTAKTDLEVIKILGNFDGCHYYTPFRGKKIVFKDGKYLMKAGGNGAHLGYRKSFLVNQGIHSYYNLSYAFYLNTSDCQFESVIPKGTNYFIGKNGDVVSEKLLIFETKENFLK